MLSGKTRIRLLHHICNHPGDHVSAMAKTMGIGVSAASQVLRRIQSRGILQTEYRGAKLIYRLGADPLVYSAAPIVNALQASLTTGGDQEGERLRRIAKGLGHRKRIALLRSLLKSPQTTYALQQELKMAFCTIRPHLDALLESGLIRRTGRTFHPVSPSHPLARALLKLLPD